MLDVGHVVWLAVPTGIRPKQLVYDLVRFCLGVVVNLERPLYLLDIVDGLQGVADASVAAEDVLLDNCSDGQFLEDLVDPVEEGVAVIDVLLELGRAFVPEAHAAVDLAVLVRSPQQDEVLRVLDLEGEQQQDGLHAFGAAVHVVPEEEVVGVLDVSVGRLIAGATKGVEETVQLCDLAMDVSEDLDRQSDLDNVSVTLTKVGSSSTAFSMA